MLNNLAIKCLQNNWTSEMMKAIDNVYFSESPMITKTLILKNKKQPKRKVLHNHKIFPTKSSFQLIVSKYYSSAERRCRVNYMALYGQLKPYLIADANLVDLLLTSYKIQNNTWHWLSLNYCFTIK